jgi:hypothetical protein
VAARGSPGGRFIASPAFHDPGGRFIASPAFHDHRETPGQPASRHDQPAAKMGGASHVAMGTGAANRAN